MPCPCSLATIQWAEWEKGEEIKEQRHTKDLCLSMSYKPVRRSLALEDAVPRAFWAEQVYWPQ